MIIIVIIIMIINSLIGSVEFAWTTKAHYGNQPKFGSLRPVHHLVVFHHFYHLKKKKIIIIIIYHLYDYDDDDDNYLTKPTASF